jgi:hypothetical protein
MYRAYKWVAAAAMLFEVQRCAQVLHLPLEPLQSKTVRVGVVSPDVIGFAGRVNGKEYSFVFLAGRLRYILRSPEKSDEELHLYDQKATITTNDAYRLASNWVAAISVDMPRLEKNARASVQQKFKYKREFPLMELPKPNEPVDLLPVFEVKWGNWNRPIIQVTIDGQGGLVAIRQEEDTYSLRSAALSTNQITRLEGISDREFTNYTEIERTKLVDDFLHSYRGKDASSEALHAPR